MKFLDYAVMVAFLLAICAMGGVFKTRRQKAATVTGTGGAADDHMLAGGHVPPWAAAISYVMALFSTHSLVSTPGEAYNYGLRKYVFEWIGPFTGLLFFFIFIRFYFSVKTFTPFAYLERRFDARVRLVVSSIYLFTRTTILAIILFSCATVFQAMAGWPVWKTSLVVGAVSIIYSASGDMKAIIWTHVLQFVVMCLGIGAVVVVCTMNVQGGAAGVIDYAFSHGGGFNFDKSFRLLRPVRARLALVDAAGVGLRLHVLRQLRPDRDPAAALDELVQSGAKIVHHVDADLHPARRGPVVPGPGRLDLLPTEPARRWRAEAG